MNAADAAQSPLRSFWMAGFEGADHVNLHGQPIDMVGVSGHDERVDGDYRRLKAQGIGAVRESIGWRLAEPRRGRFDFSRATRFAAAAERHGIQIAWTFMHYGVPRDVSLMDDAFCDRFVDFAVAAARALRPFGDAPAVYTPINEISFLAWAACESNLIHPHVGDRRDPRHVPLPDGFEVKVRLVRATLRAMAAIRAEDPRARFLHIDPLVHVVPPPGATSELAAEAARFREFQWQAWDMLAGRMLPELGGSIEALDLLGINHYHNAQWEFATGRALDWDSGDARRMPFALLLDEAWRRYRRPLVVAETGHVEATRARWLREIDAEVRDARRDGVPVHGLCLYPAIGRPDWNDDAHWHRSGLWDASPGEATVDERFDGEAPGHPGRHLDIASAAALRGCQGQAARPHAVRPLSFPTRLHRVVMKKKTLLVFCHLRWNFVFQRPQHLLSRLCAHYDVVVVEEPVHADGAPRLDAEAVMPGLTVVRPRTPLASHGFQDDQLALIGPLVADHMAARGAPYLVWFYTPMALPLLARLEPEAVVYDCMDELSAFAGAPLPLRQREAALMAQADVVLTGGPSLYEARRGRHPHLICLPSSVDAKHFAPRAPGVDVIGVVRADELQGTIPAPRLGYFGVIDERMDLALVARLADADPSWQIVMVGPVVKIDPRSLPQRPNLHWLGQQPYELLPRLIEGWEVGLMPFALNESTRFISPTKTLEYMAAGKPVVSTAIKDVVTLYGDVVRVAADHDAFVAACADALAETAPVRRERAQTMQARVAGSSWDHAADTVREALQQAQARRAAQRVPLTVDA